MAYYFGIENQHKEVAMIANPPIEAERAPDRKGIWRWSFFFLLLCAVLAEKVRKIFD